MKNNIANILRKRAFMHPQKEAFVDLGCGNRLSYSEYNLGTNRAANVLVNLGVGKGDRVALLLQNSADYMELFFAIAKIGAICVPLNWRLSADELVYILKDSGACILLFGAGFRKVVADIHNRPSDSTDVQRWLQLSGVSASIEANSTNAVDVQRWLQLGGASDVVEAFATSFEDLRCQACDDELNPVGFEDDPLYIMYTSGTTGLPKGAIHTHNTVMWAIASMAATWEMRQSDRFLVALPLFHVGALSPALMAVYCGITAVVPSGFDAVGFWKVIEAERVTNSLVVPVMLTSMLQVPEKALCDHSSLRWVAVAGAPVPISLLDAYRTCGVELQQLYGLTEACGPGCQLTGDDVARKVGSAGKPFLHNDVRVVDVTGKDVAPGERGELIIQGKHVMLGYWNLPDATAATLRDGWLHTGDVVIVDEEGFVFIVDRMKDMIISGGENIYPAEIEKVISNLPGVTGVAIIGQPDPKWGETPVAFIECNDPSLTEEMVIKFCVGKLASYKIPKAMKFVDVLPRTSTGKLKKTVLREQFLPT
ncbi:MAG: long-chain fatty acid--CoA ligase [Desulfuromonadaceae bacterium]|nr:long-chain fatty acid--CoA ligase [Desulfuromonadaceae bacterium]